ncbi:MAG TPA: sigma-70 family RNA polymerase sigma factor [Candidatus Heimdallarchaeota archaeon]|nr:sigma-70 family RNA polymerase sigma factor [Candidatus Heimdallarchaeota archaeon]
MEEQELMHLVQKGDEVAFEKIVSIYKHRIVNFLTQLTGDYQGAVDLAQETFMRVYFKANKYKPVAPLSSWIYTIASNLAKTELKKERKMSTVSIDDTENRLGEQIAAKEKNQDTYLIENLKKALNSLHPRYRLPIILKDIEGFSQEEIAQIMKRPVGTIKARISRGRDQLKHILEKDEHNLDFLAKPKEYEHGIK